MQVWQPKHEYFICAKNKQIFIFSIFKVVLWNAKKFQARQQSQYEGFSTKQSDVIHCFADILSDKQEGLKELKLFIWKVGAPNGERLKATNRFNCWKQIPPCGIQHGHLLLPV